VRALLALMRSDKAAVQNMLGQCQDLLEDVCRRLKILDPKLGEEELIKSVAVQVAKLVAELVKLSRDPIAIGARGRRFGE